MGQYAARHDLRALLRIVRRVAQHVDHDAPQSISERRWDDGRAGAGHPDAPHANKVAARLCCSWVLVLDLAFASDDELDHRLGRLFGAEEADWLTEEHAIATIRLIARVLGEPLAKARYRREIERRNRRRRGRLPLPNDDQVAWKIGEGLFSAACERAGVEPAGEREGLPAASGIVELLDCCYQAHGAQPTVPELEAFARANGLQHPRRTERYSDSMQRWKEARLEAGLDIPDEPPPRHMRPDYTQPVDPRFLPDHDQPRRNNSWEGRDDEAVLAMAGWLVRLTGTEKDGRKNYVDVSTGRRDMCPAAKLRHGYSAARDAARALIAELGRDEVLRLTAAGWQDGSGTGRATAA